MIRQFRGTPIYYEDTTNTAIIDGKAFDYCTVSIERRNIIRFSCFGYADTVYYVEYNVLFLPKNMPTELHHALTRVFRNAILWSRSTYGIIDFVGIGHFYKTTLTLYLTIQGHIHAAIVQFLKEETQEGGIYCDSKIDGGYYDRKTSD